MRWSLLYLSVIDSRWYRQLWHWQEERAIFDVANADIGVDHSIVPNRSLSMLELCHFNRWLFAPLGLRRGNGVLLVDKFPELEGWYLLRESGGLGSPAVLGYGQEACP